MIKKLLFILLLTFTTVSFSQKSLTKLSAAPNPLTSQTHIKFESTIKQVVYLVVKNILGKTVFRKPYETVKGKNSIPFYRNNLKAGMYIYMIQSNKELVSKRFIIK